MANGCNDAVNSAYHYLFIYLDVITELNCITVQSSIPNNLKGKFIHLTTFCSFCVRNKSSAVERKLNENGEIVPARRKSGRFN